MPIITHLMGGLGNQMFQYAVGRGLSIQSGTNDLRVYFEDGYRLALRSYALEPFNIAASVASSSELRSIGPERKLRRRIKQLLHIPIEKFVIREKQNFVYDPDLFKHRGSRYLIGFWQSYRYLESIRNELIRDFSLRKITPSFQASSSLISKSGSSASFHIRRADYLDPRSGFTVLPESYYRNALEALRQRVGTFDVFVFTDDVAWADENMQRLAPDLPVKVISNPGLKDYEELVLMSQCSHNVIANSSFSWWGAWLNNQSNKVVVAPAAWMPGSTPTSLQDLIPSEWVLV